MAKPRASWAVILVACLLTQQFIITTGGPVRARRGALAKKCFSWDEHDLDTTGDETENSLAKRREKRAIGLIIIGGTMAVSLAGIGFEAYLAIKGCCGLYQEACDNKDEFENIWQPKLLKISKDIDAQSLASKNLLEYVKQDNDNNRAIWEAVDKLALFTQQVVETLDPAIINSLNTKETALKQAIEAKNRTVLSLTYKQLNTDWHSVFSTAEGTALTLSSFLGQGFLLLASFSLKKYRINKIAKALDTDYGLKLQNVKVQKKFGIVDGNIKAHIKETATSQYNARMSTSKVAKFINRAGVAMAVVGAGMEIWNAIKKIDACKDVLEDTKNALRDIKTAHADFSVLLKDSQEYHQNITTQGWEFVKEQITGENITDIFKEIVTTSKNSADQTPKLKEAYQTVETFIAKIGPADYAETFTLQKSLITALKVATYPFECYYSKLRALNYVNQGCKDGDGSMQKLFDKSKELFPQFNSESCKNDAGVAYTYFSDISGTVAKAMTDGGYQADCIRNNNQTKSTACFLKDGEGYTAVDISSKLGITVDQAAYFILDCPPRTELTNKEKTQVCDLKNQGLSGATIAGVLQVPQLQEKIEAHMLSCPTLPPTTSPPLGAEDIKKVCQLKGFGMDPNAIADFIEQPLAQVQAAYDNCP